MQSSSEVAAMRVLSGRVRFNTNPPLQRESNTTRLHLGPILVPTVFDDPDEHPQGRPCFVIPIDAKTIRGVDKRSTILVSIVSRSIECGVKIMGDVGRPIRSATR